MAALLALVAAACAIVPAARAGDGVVEINQSCAVATGCFEGDGPGFPVNIDGSAGQSYRLTSDLILPSADTTAISVRAPEISIDLNGFEIATAACAGAIEPCAAPGLTLGRGITVTPGDTESRWGVSVRNGSITGMGEDAVLLGPRAEVRHLRVRWNRGSGIIVGSDSTVADNLVCENAGMGIFVERGSTVSGNVVCGNGDAGIFFPPSQPERGVDLLIFGNVVCDNATSGIQAYNGSHISENVAFNNGTSGIGATEGSTLVSNVAYGNGAMAPGDGIGARGAVMSRNAAWGNTGNGIDCFQECLVFGNTAAGNRGHGINNPGGLLQGNTVRGNYGLGLSGSDRTGYRENVFSANGSGTVTPMSAQDLGANLCNGSTTCP